MWTSAKGGASLSTTLKGETDADLAEISEHFSDNDVRENEQNSDTGSDEEIDNISRYVDYKRDDTAQDSANQDQVEDEHVFDYQFYDQAHE